MSKLLLVELLRSGFILVVAFLIGRIVTTIIHILLERVRAPKAAHLIATNIVWFLTGWIALLSSLSVLGLKEAFNLGAIGLAVSVFLIQGLVTSIVQGFIIVVEHDFDEGDYITVLNMSGTVYDIGLRLTLMVNDEGQKVAIPNSTIYNSGVLIGRPKQGELHDGTTEPSTKTIPDTRLWMATSTARSKGLSLLRSIQNFGRLTNKH